MLIEMYQKKYNHFRNVVLCRKRLERLILRSFWGSQRGTCQPLEIFTIYNESDRISLSVKLFWKNVARKFSKKHCYVIVINEGG